LPDRRPGVAEVEFDGSGGPGGDAAAEEVKVFGPDGRVEEQGGGDDGPVFDVTGGDALAGGGSVRLVKTTFDDFDRVDEFVEDEESVCWVLTALDCNGRNISSGIGDADIRVQKETDSAYESMR
jgi:hypothetical protein